MRWDSAELTNLTTIRNAFTQAFFSIGTGIGCILAYSAYLDREARLPREAVAVVGMDTAVGIVAGMVTFPVVMSFGLQEVISGSTLRTIFIALPTGLASSVPAGWWWRCCSLPWPDRSSHIGGVPVGGACGLSDGAAVMES